MTDAELVIVHEYPVQNGSNAALIREVLAIDASMGLATVEIHRHIIIAEPGIEANASAHLSKPEVERACDQAVVDESLAGKKLQSLVPESRSLSRIFAVVASIDENALKAWKIAGYSAAGNGAAIRLVPFSAAAACIFYATGKRA